MFCRVVDNFGDIGVCWRLALDLESKGHKVRLYCDDLGALEQIAPQFRTSCVHVCAWGEWGTSHEVDVLIEAFACGIPEEYLQLQKQRSIGIWIVLEYLALETWASGCHGLRSPSAISGTPKFYFFPGLGESLGGLLADRGFCAQMQNSIQHSQALRFQWAQNYGVSPSGFWISLFAYTRDWTVFFSELLELGTEFCVWVPRSYALEWCEIHLPVLGFEAKDGAWHKGGVHVQSMEFMDQIKYQEHLLLCDFAIVRGEDSFVRALLAGLPFLWQAYRQDEEAHMDKVEGFLHSVEHYFTEDEAQWAQSMLVLNRLGSDDKALEKDLNFTQIYQNLPSLAPRFKKLSQDALQRWDLSTKLTNFVHEHLA